MNLLSDKVDFKSKSQELTKTVIEHKNSLGRFKLKENILCKL